MHQLTVQVVPKLTVSPPGYANARPGQNFTFTAHGGTPPYTWKNGSYPDRLHLHNDSVSQDELDAGIFAIAVIDGLIVNCSTLAPPMSGTFFVCDPPYPSAICPPRLARQLYMPSLTRGL